MTKATTDFRFAVQLFLLQCLPVGSLCSNSCLFIADWEPLAEHQVSIDTNVGLTVARWTMAGKSFG